MNKDHLIKNTVSYHDYLISSLKDPNEAYGYLQASVEEYQLDNDAEALLIALRNIAEAQGGLSKLAAKTGLGRERLYKTISPKGNPKLSTLLTVTYALLPRK